MGIVHAAFARDLDRMRDVLDGPIESSTQREALGQHAVWMMEFLHHHHTSEDNGLWPLVRRRAPAAGLLLDSLEADHQRIVPAAEAFAAAGRAFAGPAGNQARTGLLAALDDLSDALLPHLEREVAEGMPVVAASISAAEWRAWDKQYNIKPRSFRQLGLEGHWILDGLDPERAAVMAAVIPAVPRFVLLHGFARAYRERARARWGTSEAPRRTAMR